MNGIVSKFFVAAALLTLLTLGGCSVLPMAPGEAFIADFLIAEIVDATKDQKKSKKERD